MVNKDKKISNIVLKCIFLISIIFLMLIISNIINPQWSNNSRKLLKEGYNNQVFFSEDDPHDKSANYWERDTEQKRVDNEIDEYFNNKFYQNIGNIYSNINYSDNKCYTDASNISICEKQHEVNQRLNYMQHTIDEIRGSIDGMNNRMGLGRKLHP